jgi:thymidylate kinase
MGIHVCLLGTDGSGKSTISATLSALLAAELRVPVGCAGEEFRMTTISEDHLGPNFQPENLPFLFSLSRYFKRKAKKHVENRILYQIFKVAHMLFQDASARKLMEIYDPAIVISDGNAILSACGREVNYRKKQGGVSTDVHDLMEMFGDVLDDVSFPPHKLAKMPKVAMIKKLRAFSHGLGIQGFWLPDVVFFLDVSPSSAMERIKARGKKIDRHENEHDIMNARQMYLKTLQAFLLYRPEAVVEIIKTDGKTPGEVLEEIVGRLKTHIKSEAIKIATTATPLGKTMESLSHSSFLSKIFNRKYIFNYLCGKFFKGAWREPFFICSSYGREFLKEGYSAKVMKIIYDNSNNEKNLFNKIFLGYPLHRAVHDRLVILKQVVTEALRKKLLTGKKISVFTAPSGFAYDIFKPLERLHKLWPELCKHVRIIASDLDPYGDIEPALTARAKEMDIEFLFLKGDITSKALQHRILSHAPFDIGLFVGLSGWMSKPAIINHMKMLHVYVKSDGILITDTFTAAAYSFSGYYAGFKGNYYEPWIYRTLLDYCGFDGLHASIESGRDRINHVLVARPRQNNYQDMFPGYNNGKNCQTVKDLAVY